MKQTHQNIKKTILFCSCSNTGLIPNDTKRAILASLENSGHTIITTADFCRMAVEDSQSLKELQNKEDLVVIACHHRTIQNLFKTAGVTSPEKYRSFNQMELKAEEIVTELDLELVDGQGIELPLAEEGWQPWYPVIDHDRCSSCGQCLEFCLFGVYEKQKDGSVKVVSPASCKNNCPACARICPEVAIIFPKHGEEPINGAAITDEQKAKANVQVNVDAILGDDVHGALKLRRQKAKKKLINREKLEKAMEERRRCKKEDG